MPTPRLPLTLLVLLLPCTAAAQPTTRALPAPAPAAAARVGGAVATPRILPRSPLHEAAFAQDADSASRRRSAFLGGVGLGVLGGAAAFGLYLEANAHPDDGVYPHPGIAALFIVGGAALGGIVMTEIHDVRERRRRR